MPTDNGTRRVLVDISSLALAKIVVLGLALVFVFYIRDVLMIIFVAIVLASALDPWVDALQKRRLPRAVSILLIYIVLLAIIAGAVYLIIPPLATEMQQLALSFPAYWDRLVGSWETFQGESTQNQFIADNIQGSLDAWRNGLSSAAGGVLTTISSVFGGIISLFMVLVIAFYLTVEEQAMKRVIRSSIPVRHQPYATHLMNRIQEKIGRWLRGQLTLSLIIFAVSYIGLTILGVKYALVLALFAGVTELIPYVGPFIGLIPAAFIGLTQSPLLALAVIILYVLIQQLENYVLVPKVMQRAVGLSPIVVIIAMLVGAKIAGLVGVVLAVPVATAISVVIGDILGKREDGGEDEIPAVV